MNGYSNWFGVDAVADDTNATTGQKNIPKSIAGGVLNSKAIDLSKPE